MKNNLIWMTILCALVFAIYLIYPKIEDKTVAVAPDGPAEVVGLYLESAMKADEAVVSTLVTEIPDSYSDLCQKTDNSSVQNSSIAQTSKQREVRKAEIEIKTNKNLTDKPDAEFLSLSNPKSKISLAFHEATYLYASQASFEKVKIVDSEIFQDEAIVNVEYVKTKSASSYRKFLLKKTADGWKIFMTVSPDSAKTVINENYAKERPLCK